MNETAVLEQLDNRRITLALQPYAVEALYEAGPFPLMASRGGHSGGDGAAS